MAWRLHDYIHFHLTSTRLSDIQTEPNPLQLIDRLLDEDQQIDCWITFRPQYQEIYDAFNKIIRKDLQYITTVKQVREFVEFCFMQYYEKSNDSLDLDEMLTIVHDKYLHDDMLVLIQLED